MIGGVNNDSNGEDIHTRFSVPSNTASPQREWSVGGSGTPRPLDEQPVENKEGWEGVGVSPTPWDTTEVTEEILANERNRNTSSNATPLPGFTREPREPTATPTVYRVVPTVEPTRTARNEQAIKSYPCCYVATRYGGGIRAGEINYNGQTTSCGKTYYSTDESILATPYGTLTNGLPCGTTVRACNETIRLPASVGEEQYTSLRQDASGVYAVRCVTLRRVDVCPGCLSNHIDLSEAGIAILCGLRFNGSYSSTCDRVEGLSLEIK